MPKIVHINPVGGDLYVVRDFHPPHVDAGLPGLPGMPDHELPHLPGIPDNSLPTNPPPPTAPPGTVVVLVKGPTGKWHWSTVVLGTVITPLPEPPPVVQPKA